MKVFCLEDEAITWSFTWEKDGKIGGLSSGNVVSFLDWDVAS